MHLVVVSSKRVWRSSRSSTGVTTDGGFPFQMKALSELFDKTTLIVPCLPESPDAAQTPLVGHELEVLPLTYPVGRGWRRKIDFPFWLLRNAPVVVRSVWRADAIHAPIPGDVGTFAMVLALLLRKPLFIRHCGNWLIQETAAERFWKWFMERFAGGRNVMLATGGSEQPPSARNPSVGWVFSTSLTQDQLNACAKPAVAAAQPGHRLIITCRQEARKGTDVVIRAMALLKEELPDLHLDVCGEGADLKAFRQLASELGVEGRVEFHGNIPHGRVLELLRRADLFCFPTRSSEGFPKAVLEALACGLPVITTRVSVLPQLLQSGAGRLLDEATPAALAEAIRFCLSDAHRYQKMSSAAAITARAYSLEGWRDFIGARLRSAWGPLKRREVPS